MLQYRVLLLLLSTCSVFHSVAQPFATRLYTTADGLSDNYIFTVYQDSHGYLWIGTSNGFNRFDGKRFVSYGIQQGLPSMAATSVYEDSRHRLWIGTKAGMAELKGDSCYVYPVNDKQEILYVSGFLEPDSSKLWATTNKGVYEFRKGQWVKIALYPGHENAFVSKIIVSKSSSLINYHNTELLQIAADGKSKMLLQVESAKAYYNSLHEINNNIFISTYSGLFQWQEDKWNALFEDTLRKKYIFCSYHDKSNRWWFATKQDGILVAVRDKDKINYFRIPLSVNLASGFFEDRDNNIWVACFEGLLKISPSSYQSISFSAFNDFHFIRNCMALPQNRIAASADNGKLLIFKTVNDSVKIIATGQLRSKEDFIDYYTFDNENRMWFTTREGGLCRLDGAAIKDFSALVSFKNEGFRDVAFNKKTKQLFVCGDSVLLAGNEKRLDIFVGNNNERIPLPLRIFIREDNGSMLVQTIENGLFLVTPGRHLQSLGKTINFNRAILVNEKKNDPVIWAACQGRGILKYIWKGINPPELVETIDEKNGLPNNFILDLAMDNQNKLWVGTTKGIIVMQKDLQDRWLHEDIEMRPAGNPPSLSFSKLCVDSSGTVWMNIQNSLLRFDSKKINISDINTATVIEKISLFNRPTNWAALTDSVESYQRLPVNPILNYNQNSLTISFNALQYRSNSQPEYSDRLMPADTEWSSVSSSNTVSFYQLNPGSYTFEVRSHIKGFGWSQPATFSFKIKKPFWETWWFRLAVIAGAAMFIVFIFRYRLNQLRLETAMQNQLHELETKALRLQMNPHFIHNALNSIQSLVVNNKTNEASIYISKFAKLLRQTLENSEKGLVNLDKELYSLQLYVDLERLRMNMDIGYNVHLGEDMDLSAVKIPSLILQPFVENALWHGLSRKEGDKKINLHISAEQDWLICELTDNGIGRKKAAEYYQTFPEGHLSKAITIIRQRIADFNQSSFTEPISFIDLQENGVATGTKVIIRIKAS